MQTPLPEKKMLEVNPFSVIQTIAEERIAEAQLAGAFDNLPGQGKPLPEDATDNIPAELRMAYKILSNAGCLPPELAERKEIGQLADLLEHCEDEQERVRQMQKLRCMVLHAKTRFQRSILLEQEDPYYDQILEKITCCRHK